METDAADGDSPGLGPGSEALAGAVWGQKQSILPGLYLVPTPIGNLQDITLRALHVLRAASVVLAEDTRHTGRLLSAYGIPPPELMSYHAHNERARATAVVRRLAGGSEVAALVSDAGTPGISDPGAVLVQAAIDAGVRVVPLPGPAAFVSAAVASGLSTSALLFCGFLPPKSGARRTRLAALAAESATLVFYAPPHGLAAVLADMAAELGGTRRCCVARELTKLHEELFRSDLAGALAEFTSREPRGEFVVCVEGADADARKYALLAEAITAGNAGLAAATDPADGEDAAVQPAAQSAVREGAESGAGATRAAAAAALASLPEGEVLDTLLRRLLQSGMPTKAAAKEAARLIPGQGRKEAYARALQLANE